MSGDFWSRRREAVTKEARADQAAAIAAEDTRVEAGLAEVSDEELLAEANLPDPDTLDSPEAVREFLASALPQRLKTRALRRLWRLNPVLANVDGLVDYGGDFTDSAMVIENMQTAYQVGRGMLKHVEELARQAEAKANEVLAESTEDPDEVEEVVDEAVEEMAETEDVPVLVAIAPDEDIEPHPMAPRRMTFTFDEQRAG